MKVEKGSEFIPDDIIEQCAAGNRTAQKALYDLLLPYLASVSKRYLINHSDMEDALQESFVNIFSKIDQFDSERGKFKTWAVKITINCSLKLNKKMYKLKTTEIENGSADNSIEPAVYSDMNNDEMILFLRKMPNAWFEVFNMYVVEGFSHREISEVLGIDDSLSRQRLSRARKWINDQLVPDTGEQKIKSFM